VNRTKVPSGIIPGLNTPTTEKGELDEESLRSLVRHNIEWGVDGLAVSIIAGEFYKFSDEERSRSFEIVIDETNGKVPVWAGVNHIGTEPSVKLGRQAKDLGAFGIISLPPFVGTKTDSAAYEHFSTLLTKVDIPMMIQDAEDFTGVHMRTNLYVELMKEYSNVTSLKVEGGETLKKIEDVLGTRELRNLSVLGGMGARLLFQELKLGTNGSIPGSCLTDIVVKAYRYYTRGEYDMAEKQYADYREWINFTVLNSLSFTEIQKETSRLRGVIKSSHTRSPHVPLGSEAKKRLADLVRRVVPQEPITAQ